MVSPLDRVEPGQLKPRRSAGRRNTAGSMFVLTLLIFFGMAAVHTDGAHASLSCAFDPATGTLSLAPGAGALRASVGVSAGPSPPAGAIALTDLSAANAPVVVACAGGATGRAPSTPTTANTARILVAGGSESDLLEIDLSGGSFRSGLSADGEVAWRVALAAGTDTFASRATSCSSRRTSGSFTEVLRGRFRLLFPQAV